MAAVAAANESDLLDPHLVALLRGLYLRVQATDAGLQPAPTPAAALDPRLLMAARRGDSEALKDLFQLKDDDQQLQGTRPDDGGSGAPTTAAAATTTTTTSVAAAPSISPPDVIVEVEPPPAPPAPPHDENAAALPARQTLAGHSAVPVVLDVDGVAAATEEGSLLVHSKIVEQVVVEPPPPHDDVVAAPLPPPPVPVLDVDGVTTHTEGGSLLLHSEIVEQVVVEPPLHDDAALPARQPPAAAPAGSFPAAVPVLDEDGVTMEGDSLLHVVAACGDTQEYLDCAKMIVRNKEKKGGAGAKRRALEARNNKGDTPLHCAARAGNVKMIACLVDLLYKATGADMAAVKTFLGRKNRCGETALHQAVRAASKDAIDELLSLDPELACSSSSSREEDAGGAACSPFFLAVSLWGEDDEMDIARHLFLKTRPSIRSNLSYYCSGPDGRNVLHAAVSRASVKTVILLSQLLTSADPASVETQTPPGRLLLSQLASQGDKENGSTPLHLAASLVGLPSSWQLFPPQVRPPPPGATPLWPLVGSDGASLSVPKEVSWLSCLCGSRYRQILPLMLYLVLNANETMAYQSDKAGMYPIHVAAGSGSRDAVKMLLERCPDCATLRDAKGRTLLHVAAEEGRLLVVKYVCQQSRRAHPGARLPELLSSILNAQDIKGDTALHRAIYAVQRRVVELLIGTQQVRLDVQNKVGMRPIDVSWTTMPLEAYYAWDPRIEIRRSLLQVGAPYGENDRGDLLRRSLLQVGAPYGENDRGDLLCKKCVLSNQQDKEMSENLTAAAQVLALFSVLITTVTFASAFTLPGGYRSAGDGDGGVAGTPVLAGPKSYAFDAFILSDTLAFLCSLLATSLLLYAGVPYGTLTNRFMLINFAYALMWHAARSLVAAFALGLYVVLLPVARTIAIGIVGGLMIMSVYGFLKGSEGIDAMIVMGTSQRRRSKWGTALALILRFLDRFWSYIIIFALPAICRWARLP